MTLKVGLIGCGHIARFHSRNIRDVQNRGLLDIDYHAVCDRDIARAEAFGQLAGCALVTDEPADVIERCDALYVCTETAGHPALIEAIAAAGKPVFCEKPLARNLAEATAMTEAIRHAGVTHQVGLVLNYSPVYRVLAEIMSADHGPLLTAHLRDDQFFPIRGHYGSDWRANVESAGGGTLIEHSIHDVDLLRRLFGEIEAVRCHLRFTTEHRGIETVAMATFQHAGGHQTTLTSVWHDIDSRASSRQLEVFFQRARFETAHDYFGTLTCEIDDQPALTLSNDEILARFMRLENLHPRDEDLRSLGGLCDRRFLECAAAGRPATPSFEDALIAHRVVDACYRSAAAGQEVRLTPGS
jgi:predicted dehydrogenase